MGVAAALVASTPLGAVQFQVIRIGDTDGFGYGSGSGYTTGTSASNADRLGNLGAGDRLPSLNGNAEVAAGDADDFDNRAGEGSSAVGAVIHGATTGAEFTDIALSRSYDTSAAATQVWNHGASAYGAGGAFPMPPSAALPNQPGFVFDFFVAWGDITTTTRLFFNLVFGDYDESPAVIQLTSADGSTRGIALNTQGSADGLIQEASLKLNFNEVFTPSGGGYNGYLVVDFLAQDESYTAFDYVEIGVLNDPGGVSVKVPGVSVADAGSTFGLVFAPLLGMFVVGRRLRAKDSGPGK